ncbi:MAG: FecR domain-containing protein [Beijerinckiaceae bacterium]
MNEIPYFGARVVRGGLAALALVAGLAACAQGAAAQQRIGEAQSVRNQVVRVSAGRSSGLAAGGSIFRNETVRTGKASSAKLVFLDRTNLAIGPVSSVVLNQFVYSSGPSQALNVNLARGAFRFTTGVLDKRAYKINTPVATIGVRGTILDILARGGSTIVRMVDESIALVCSVAGQCLELRGAGDSVIVTSSGIRRTTGTGRTFSFASICGSNPGLCSQSQIADASDALSPPGDNLGDALCGR